jgi:hypothetical protein
MPGHARSSSSAGRLVIITSSLTCAHARAWAQQGYNQLRALLVSAPQVIRGRPCKPIAVHRCLYGAGLWRDEKNPVMATTTTLRLLARRWSACTGNSRSRISTCLVRPRAAPRPLERFGSRTPRRQRHCSSPQATT